MAKVKLFIIFDNQEKALIKGYMVIFMYILNKDAY